MEKEYFIHQVLALFSWHPTKKWNPLSKILKSICIRRTGTKSWFLRWALQLKTLNKKCFKNGGNAFKCFCFLSAHNRVKLRAWNINESRSENQVWRLIKERGLCNIQKKNNLLANVSYVHFPCSVWPTFPQQKYAFLQRLSLKIQGSCCIYGYKSEISTGK